MVEGLGYMRAVFGAGNEIWIVMRHGVFARACWVLRFCVFG